MIGDAGAAGASASAMPAGVAASAAPARASATQSAAATAAGNDARVRTGDDTPAGGDFDQLLASAPAATPAATAAPDAEPDAPADAAAPLDAGATPWLLLLAQMTPAAAPAATGSAAAAVSPDAAEPGLRGPAALRAAAGPAVTAAAVQPAADPVVAPGSTLGEDTPAPFAALADAGTGPSGTPATPAAAAAAASAPAPEALPAPAATLEASTSATVPPPAMHATPAPTHAPAAAAAPVPTPVPQPADPSAGYDDSFGTQVSWLAEQRIGQAEIRISPEHLGAIDIRLRVEGNEVRAEFHSAQPEVRQALEASLPRLRELLGQQGLQLGHAGVGHGHRPHDGGTALARDPGTASRTDGDAVPAPAFRRARGLLDVYA